jgi:hypothetical protein
MRRICFAELARASVPPAMAGLPAKAPARVVLARVVLAQGEGMRYRPVT